MQRKDISRNSKEPSTTALHHSRPCRFVRVPGEWTSWTFVPGASYAWPSREPTGGANFGANGNLQQVIEDDAGWVVVLLFCLFKFQFWVVFPHLEMWTSVGWMNLKKRLFLISGFWQWFQALFTHKSWFWQWFSQHLVHQRGKSRPRDSPYVSIDITGKVNGLTPKRRFQKGPS